MLWLDLKRLQSSNWKTRKKTIEKLDNVRDKRVLQVLVRMAFEDVAVRRAAAEAVERNADSSIFPLLLEGLSLQSRDGSVPQRILARTMLRIGDDSAVVRVTETLIPLLCDVSSFSAVTTEYFRKHSAETVPVLVAAVGREATEKDTRLRVQEALNGLGPEAVLPLLKALSTGNARVKAAVGEALGHIKDPQCIGVLVDLLQDESYDVISAAAKALEGFGWQPSDQAEKVWYFVGLGRESALKTLNADAVPTLIDALRNNDFRVKRWAACGLAKLHDARALEPLISALLERRGLWPDAQIGFYWYAVRWLGELGDERAVQPLLDFLIHNCMDDWGWQERDLVIDTLASLGDPRAGKPLVEMFESLEVPSEKRMWNETATVNARSQSHIVSALGEIGGPDAVRLLIHLVPTGDFKGKTNNALKKLNPPEAIRVLTKILETEQYYDFRVKDALENLLSIVRSRLAQIATEDLKGICDLPDTRLKCDFTPIKSIARTELARREAEL